MDLHITKLQDNSLNTKSQSEPQNTSQNSMRPNTHKPNKTPNLSRYSKAWIAPAGDTADTFRPSNEYNKSGGTVYGL